SKQLIRNIRDGVRIAWIVVAVAAVLIVVAIASEFQITGIASEFQALTVTGLAGLTISLALQTTLSNIIAGVLLFSDKTLRLNDVISYSGIRGTVVRVGLRSTLIRTQEGNIAIIGNSTLMSGPFINYSAEERLLGIPRNNLGPERRCFGINKHSRFFLRVHRLLLGIEMRG